MHRICLAAGAALALACALPAAAADDPPGYRLAPTLATPAAAHDPDGVWRDADLAAVGSPPRRPDILVARVTTPAGEWILSQLGSGCTPTSDCDFVLVLRSDGKTVRAAAGILSLGAVATLSYDYTKLFAPTYAGIETISVKSGAAR